MTDKPLSKEAIQRQTLDLTKRITKVSKQSPPHVVVAALAVSLGTMVRHFPEMGGLAGSVYREHAKPRPDDKEAAESDERRT